MTGTPLHTVYGTVEIEHLPQEVLTAEAIANTLAKINRFAGRTRVPWSVAAHSIVVSRLSHAHGDDSAWALLHDAHEAFIGDVITPAVDFVASQSMPVAGSAFRTGLDQAKSALDKQIMAAWGISSEVNRVRVSAWDNIVYLAEARLFFGDDLGIEDRTGSIARARHLIIDLNPGHRWQDAAASWIAEAEKLAAMKLLTPPTYRTSWA